MSKEISWGQSRDRDRFNIFIFRKAQNAIRNTGRNERYLPGVELPAGIKAEADATKIIAESEQKVAASQAAATKLAADSESRAKVMIAEAEQKGQQTIQEARKKAGRTRLK